MKGKDADHAQRDLVQAIEAGDFPKWNMKIQVMTDEEAKTFPWNPFDLTKIWPHADFPLIEVGVLELNQVPSNYFRDVEQSAFAPAHVVDGIGYSPDKMLQGRLLSYPDAHRYRLGANYEHIPVNRCPYMTNNYQRDGAMQMGENGNDSPISKIGHCASGVTRAPASMLLLTDKDHDASRSPRHCPNSRWQ